MRYILESTFEDSTPPLSWFVPPIHCPNLMCNSAVNSPIHNKYSRSANHIYVFYSVWIMLLSNCYNSDISIIMPVYFKKGFDSIFECCYLALNHHFTDAQASQVHCCGVADRRDFDDKEGEVLYRNHSIYMRNAKRASFFAIHMRVSVFFFFGCQYVSFIFLRA